MLKNLRIKNFIIVEDLELNFSKGLQVLTGETGAGKSIIVGAIDIIFGGDIQEGIHYDENKKVILEASFNIDKQNKKLKDLLIKHEVENTENEIFFTKEISTNQRSKIFLNGRRISIPIVEEFRSLLLDFHSQRDQQQLFNNDYQLEILDKFANLITKRKNFEKKYEQLVYKMKELRTLKTKEKDAEDRIQLFKYQIKEIENLDLKIGEEEQLQSELKLLSNAEDILNQAKNIEFYMYENEESVYDNINSFIAMLSQFAEDEEHLKNAVSLLQNALANIEESISELRDVQEIIDVDKELKTELEERLDAVNNINSKYKKKIPQLLDYVEEIKGKIDAHSSNKEKIITLEKDIEEETRSIWEEAEELSTKRKESAIKLEKQIKRNIKKLAISDAKVKIQFDKVGQENNLKTGIPGLNNTGKDSIEIYFSANRGVRLQPFKVVASGGELSRFLLTIKKILSDKIEKKTVIFDEIDQGIGGKTSELLAEFIHKIGSYHQILCISHLPQIASYGDKHFAIVKRSSKKTSEVEVFQLEKNKKRQEIARMLAGKLTKLSLMHADELIKKSRGEN